MYVDGQVQQRSATTTHDALQERSHGSKLVGFASCNVR
jgi:hypothetical protein